MKKNPNEEKSLKKCYVKKLHQFPWIQILNGIHTVYESEQSIQENQAEKDNSIPQNTENGQNQELKVEYICQEKNQIENTEQKWECKGYFIQNFDKLYQKYRNSDKNLQQSLKSEIEILSKHQNNNTYNELDCHGLGRSGSSFYYSHKKEFILKSISKSHFKTFTNNLSEPYFKYFLEKSDITEKQQQDLTLLNKIYGIFSFQYQYKHYYIIMLENIFSQLEKSDVLLRIYDLKGSTVGRQFEGFNDELIRSKKISHSTQKEIVKGKDIDYRDNYEDNVFEFMDETQQNIFFQQFQTEINILKQCNLMDYSILLAIGQVNQQQQQQQIQQQQQCKYEYIMNAFKRFQVQEYPDLFFSITIIDFLQEYDGSKKLENAFKNFTHYLFSSSSEKKNKRRQSQQQLNQQEKTPDKDQENRHQSLQNSNTPITKKHNNPYGEKDNDNEDWQISSVDSEQYSERILKFIQQQFEGGQRKLIEQQLFDYKEQNQQEKQEILYDQNEEDFTIIESRNGQSENNSPAQSE